MSIADIAAAVIGLRETTYKDHQRLASETEALREEVTATREAISEVLDHRLSQSAQAFRDLEHRAEERTERRIEAVLRTIIDVAGRLDALVAGADDDGVDPAELCARLRSLAAPRDLLRALVEEEGVLPFDSVGQPYQPTLHEVVRREHVAGCVHEHVSAELAGGWWRADANHAVVRAKVVVTAPPLWDGADE